MSLFASVLASSSDGGGGAAIGFLVFIIAFWIVMIVAGWKVFEKAGESGWKILIPIYNIYVLLRIVGRPGWWLILFFIPIVSIVIGIIVLNDMSKSFGKGAGFTVGLIFLPFIFWPILGFGSATYLGAAANLAFTPSSAPPPPPPPATPPGATPPPPPPPSA